MMAPDLTDRVLDKILSRGNEKGGFSFSKRKLSIRAIFYSRISLVFSSRRVPTTFLLPKTVSIV